MVAIFRTILTLSFFISFAGITQAQAPLRANESPIIHYANLPYVEAGDPRQVLDLYLPANPQVPPPLLFIVHGGGFVFGDQSSVAQVSAYYAEQGYAVIAATYRLAPQNPYPAPIEDIFCALAWAYDSAEQYGYDMEQLVLIGESAGANAAALLGLVDEPMRFLQDCPHQFSTQAKAKGVIAYYMPVDLSSCVCFAAKQMAALYLGVDAEAFAQEEGELRDLWAEAAPLAWIDESDPPFLLLHGTRDTLIALSESYLMAQALTDAGVAAEVIEIEGAMHGFFDRLNMPVAQEALSYSEAQILAWLND